jgi:hypothetical protein
MASVEIDGDEVVVIVDYDAASNISYRGHRTFRYNVDDWFEASEQDRYAWLDEDFLSWLRADVEAIIPTNLGELDDPRPVESDDE